MSKENMNQNNETEEKKDVLTAEELKDLKASELDKVAAGVEEVEADMTRDAQELAEQAEAAKQEVKDVLKDIEEDIIAEIDADVEKINADRNELLDKTQAAASKANEAIDHAFDSFMENEHVQDLAAKADDVVDAVRGSEAYQEMSRKTDEMVESLKNNEQLQEGIEKTKDATAKLVDNVVEGTKEGAQFVKHKTEEVLNSDEFKNTVDKAKEVASDVGKKVEDTFKGFFKK